MNCGYLGRIITPTYLIILQQFFVVLFRVLGLADLTCLIKHLRAIYHGFYDGAGLEFLEFL
jgi:hypothetical protein